jgi:hypothetical protein
MKKKTLLEDIVAIIGLFLTLAFLVFSFSYCGNMIFSSSPDKTEKTESATPPSLELEIPTYNLDPPELPDVPEPDYVTCYAASRESDRYHDMNCHYVDQILPQNLIYFFSKSEARSEGYKPCSVCDP